MAAAAAAAAAGATTAEQERVIMLLPQPRDQRALRQLVQLLGLPGELHRIQTPAHADKYLQDLREREREREREAEEQECARQVNRVWDLLTSAGFTGQHGHCQLCPGAAAAAAQCARCRNRTPSGS
eukprot:TRINITY_DN2424_c0_g1_i1.p1 TRINITY_DN2424_c0_g1~~TRINITY_DN2424_c0_g1_i1.p1  ORF type:complete len:126 (-),score=29.31 TRINITY_DN2424_c0_g1_i1:115-492(-)